MAGCCLVVSWGLTMTPTLFSLKAICISPQENKLRIRAKYMGHFHAAIIMKLAAALTLYIDMPQHLLCTRISPKASGGRSYELFVIINIFPYV